MANNKGRVSSLECDCIKLASEWVVVCYTIVMVRYKYPGAEGHSISYGSDLQDKLQKNDILSYSS